MPTPEEQAAPPRRSVFEYLDKFLTRIAAAVAAITALTALPSYWKWPLVCFFLALSVVWFREARKRRRLRLSIPEPDELRLTEKEFRGRADDISRIKSRIAEQRILCLVGDSGCGKTTLVDWGLLKEPALLERFRMVKLDAYGSDWITGPLLALFGCLAPAKGSADPPPRAAGEEVQHLLERLKEEILSAPKPVLIIFDQFDHYLSAFHELLQVDGEPIEPVELRRANPFWRCILELADQGAIHCLFVIESRQLWLAQPFGVDRKRYGLRPLRGNYARGLLTSLLQRARSPVSDPEVEELIYRISEDLEKSGLLPVKLDFTLRSLQYLKPLSARTYSSLSALIALGVGGELKAVEAEKYEVALSALLELAPKGEGKPVAKTIDELAASVQGVSPAELETLFTSLEERRITKSQPDPSGPQRWTLYHEFLVGVLAELRADVQQQEGRLRYAFDRYQRTPWPGKILELLPPWAALRFLLPRRDSRVNLGGARGFALLSLFFGPAVVALFLLALVWNDYRQDAERTGVQIVTRFNSHPGLQAEDDEAIWLLHGSPALVKRRALEGFLDSETNADRFLTHADLILQSLSGLRPEKALSALEAVWQERCRDNLQNLEGSRRRVCALIENEIPQSNVKTWEGYLAASSPEEVLVRLFAKLQPADQDTALVLLKQAIVAGRIYTPGRLAAALLQNSNPAEAARRAPGILAALASRDELMSIQALQEFWRALGGTPEASLKEHAATLLNNKLRSHLRKVEGDDLLQWAVRVSELRAEGWPLNPELMTEAKEILLRNLRPGSPSQGQRRELLGPLGAFRQELTAEEASLAKATILASSEDCRSEASAPESLSLWELEGFSWLIPALSQNEAEDVLNRFSAGYGFSRVYSERPRKEASQFFRRELKRLTARLDEATSLQIADRYQARLRDAADLQSADSLLMLIGSLASSHPGLLSRQDEFIAELLRLAKPENQFAARPLAYVLRTWWPDLQPRARQRVAALLLERFKKMIALGGQSDDTVELASLLDDLDLSLPVEESRAQLERMLLHSVLPCEVLAPLARQETLDLLVGQGFRYPVCPLGISRQVVRKLEKLELLNVDELGQRVGEIPVLDRGRLAAWVRESGYDLDRPLLFRGVL